MSDFKKETWARSPADTKAHLYFDEGSVHGLRRLCHRKHIQSSEVDVAPDAERCRLCLNIRGLIPTRRNRKRSRT